MMRSSVFTTRHVRLLMMLTLGIYIGYLVRYPFQQHHQDAKSSDLSSAEESTLFVQQQHLQALQAKQLANEKLIDDLQKELQEYKAAKVEKKVVDTPSSSSSSSTAAVATLEPQHLVCQSIATAAHQSIIPTALSIWMKHLTTIHAASRLAPNDRRYDFHDFTAQLLHIVSPRLPRSVVSLAADWTPVQQVMDVAATRWNYLQSGKNNDPKQQAVPPPPLKILVLGGSVLLGRNCRKLVRDLQLPMRMPQRECTWSHRLQVFLNQIFDCNDLVQVTKISMGGTNTAVGSMVLEYDLLPDEAKHPDIIINAYSTNDMHVLTALEAASGNQTLRDKVFEMIQDFVRAVLRNRPCGEKTPLLLHLDDYLGNEQRQVLDTTELSQSVHVLSQYYGFSSMSYANVVRELVYGDTHERWFSPEGWWPGADKEMAREIHPGMGMHIATVWIVAYNLLHLVTTYCSMEAWIKHTTPALALDYNRSILAELIPLKGFKTHVPGKPRERPPGIPPLLTPQLSLENVTELWRNNAAQDDKALKAVDCKERGESSYSRCIFSWVGGLSLQQNNRTWIEEYFVARLVETTAWTLADDNGKLGFVPASVGDSMVLEFANLTQPIRSVTFFTMKSYGPAWADSRIKVETEVRSSSENDDDDKWQGTTVNELVGFHDKNTSETYTEPIVMPEVSKGSSLRIKYSLTSGMTFKILGLAVCS